MKAIIDIGSNTVRVNVYETKGHQFRLMFSVKEMAGLISHIEDNVLSEAGLLNLLRILNRFKDVLDNLKIHDVYPFATASLRKIDNSQEVLKRIKDELGFTIDLISGEEEAYLGYIGSHANVMSKEGLVVDIGGGSTEFVHFYHNEVVNTRSLAMGSLRMYKNNVKKILPKKSELQAIQEDVHANLEVFDRKKIPYIPTIIGVGGTNRAALKLENYIYNHYGNRQISYERLLEIYESISTCNSEAQSTILKVIPDRVHTIIPGLIILIETMKFFECKDVVVSQYGAREGYLIKNVLKR